MSGAFFHLCVAYIMFLFFWKFDLSMLRLGSTFFIIRSPVKIVYKCVENLDWLRLDIALLILHFLADYFRPCLVIEIIFITWSKLIHILLSIRMFSLSDLRRAT